MKLTSALIQITSDLAGNTTENYMFAVYLIRKVKVIVFALSPAVYRQSKHKSLIKNI